MTFPVFLAHGALGNFDEVIFLGVAVIFVTLMGISWVKSRNSPPDFDEAETPQEKPSAAKGESQDRFQLD